MSTDYDLRLELNGKRLCPTDSVKCLGIKIDENLTWHNQISNLVAELDRANAILPKTDVLWILKKLKSIYHTIFEPPFN